MMGILIVWDIHVVGWLVFANFVQAITQKGCMPPFQYFT